MHRYFLKNNLWRCGVKIVVIGDGKVGKAIVEHICQEDHDVVIIDNNPNVIEQMVNRYDVMGICGNGANYEIQKSAHIDKADIVVAATASDEINILSCFVARQLGAKSTIARVRNYDYNSQIELMKKDLGITMTINPEAEASNEIMNIVNFPEAIRVDSFGDGNVDLVELYIPESNPLIGKSLSSIHTEYKVKILVCAVQRDEEVFIPTGSFTFHAKDKIHITASRDMIKIFLNKLGLIETKIKNVLIIGGGKITIYLAEALLKSRYNVKIIEKEYDHCVYLSTILPNATIIHGDGSDQNILKEEGIDDTDALICLTGSDEENIIISMYAYKEKVKKIITKVNTPSFASLLETIGVASVISPKEITSSKIIRYVRSSANKHGSNILTLHKLVNNRVEAVEFLAKENSRVLNIPLKDIKLKQKILITSIIRNNEVIIPSGMDYIMANDRVIVVTDGQYLDDLNDILE